MSFALWLNDEEKIDLGDPFQLFMGFREMAKVAGKEEDSKWGQLYYMPHTNEEPRREDYLQKVRDQARRFLEKYRHELREHTIWLLEKLAGWSKGEDD
jgi:hypothetical protein